MACGLLTTSLSGPLLLRNTLRAIDGSALPPAWFISSTSYVFGSAPAFLYPLTCTLLMVANLVAGIFIVHGVFFVQPLFARRVRAVLSQIIFQKALRLQRNTRQQFSGGFIMNLVTADLVRIDWFLIFAHSSWCNPITLLVAVALLFRLVGAPALWGFLALLIIFSTSLILSKRQSRLRKLLNTQSDARVGLIRESLLHIKSAKLQGWEESLAKKIQNIRIQETLLARKLVRLAASLAFLSNCAPAVAMAVTTICMVSRQIPLDATTLFPMLALFTLLRFAMSQLPETVYNLVEAKLALDRIQTFLDAPEHQTIPVDPSQSNALHLSGVTCRWPDGPVALDIESLTVAHGELVVVVGGVGAGKSTLLLAMLGEIEAEHGQISVGGRISFVAQNPWITSDSIRNNIVCGAPFDSERYRTAVYASGLAPDLEALPHGDATQIGERGINLSGGQRHRVALARAYYCGGDIFLFDDPLSALDPAVANHVFTSMILGELSSKTRIVVSHRVEYALAADRVIVMEGGKILEQGAPADLRATGTRFAELLHYHEQMNKDSAKAISMQTALLQGTSLDEASDLEEDTEQEAPSLITTEDRAIGAVSTGTTRRYIAQLAPGIMACGLLALFLLRQGAAVSTDLWLTFGATIHAIHPRTFILGYLLAIAIVCVTAYLRATVTLSRGLQAGLTCHDRLLTGVLHAPMRFFESNPVGRILNRFSRDIETVELFLPRSILDAGACMFDVLAMFTVIVCVAPVTLVAIAPIAVAYLFLFTIYRPVSRDLQRLSATTLSPVFAVLSESLSGVETLRAARLQAQFSRYFSQAVDRYGSALVAQTGANRWLGIRLEILGAMVILAVGLVICLKIDSLIGIAFCGLVLTYASSITGSMNWAIRSLSAVENCLTSFERIERYANTPSEVRAGSSAPPGWPWSGEITFHKLSVRYRPELPLALSNLSFQIAGGRRVGIIGRTGSGKSTLLLALMRLLEPAEGHIEIDGINLSTLSLPDLRTSLVVVPQEPVLFSGLLRESLDPFNECSDSEIHSALKRVELWQLFLSLPNGLDTEVHEGGFNFSSGQRQLICLARALLRKSKVIVLDEATASIDVQTDYAIQRAIREEFSESTVLVIAHRLGTVLDSDLIISLHQGSVAEIGSPVDLLATPGSILSQFVNEAQRQATQTE